MDNLLRVTESIKRLLAEAELKDIVGKLKKGDVVQMELSDGDTHVYKIEGIHGGDLLIKDNNNDLFTFNVKDYTDKGLLIHQYINDEKGGSITLKVKSLTMGTPHGQIYRDIQPVGMELIDFDIPKKGEEDGDSDKEDDGMIDFDLPKNEPDTPEEDDADIKSDEGTKKIAFMNDVILSAKEGSNLHFTINISEEESEVLNSEEDNNVVIEVTNINEKYIYGFLSNINGPISGVLSKLLNNKKLIIRKDDLIKVENGEPVLNVYDINNINNPITIPKITDTRLDEYKDDPEDDEETQQTLSKSELEDIMLNNKTLANYWLRTPGAMGALANASPSGRYTIAQQMKKLNLDNSYLTVGSKVKFRVMNQTKIGDGGVDIEYGKEYVGTMAEENTIIALGAVHQKHWKITLIDPEDNKNHKYKVKYAFCYNRNRCESKSGGLIKVLDITNKKKK